MRVVIECLMYIVSFCIGLIVCLMMVDDVRHEVKKKDWLCTKQEITSDAFPQQFECSQYTRKIKQGEDE